MKLAQYGRFLEPIGKQLLSSLPEAERSVDGRRLQTAASLAASRGCRSLRRDQSMTRLAVLFAVLVPMAWLIQFDTERPLFVPAPSSLTVGRSPGDMVLADLNKDGHLDIVTTHGRDRVVQVRYGNGRLSFAASDKPIRFSYSPAEIAVGDINNDGFLDLGVANHDNYEVDILLGHGSQIFTAAAGSPVVASIGGKPHTHGFALVDIRTMATRCIDWQQRGQQCVGASW